MNAIPTRYKVPAPGPIPTLELDRALEQDWRQFVTIELKRLILYRWLYQNGVLNED